MEKNQDRVELTEYAAQQIFNNVNQNRTAVERYNRRYCDEAFQNASDETIDNGTFFLELKAKSLAILNSGNRMDITPNKIRGLILKKSSKKRASGTTVGENGSGSTIFNALGSKQFINTPVKMPDGQLVALEMAIDYSGDSETELAPHLETALNEMDDVIGKGIKPTNDCFCITVNIDDQKMDLAKNGIRAFCSDALQLLTFNRPICKLQVNTDTEGMTCNITRNEIKLISDKSTYSEKEIDFCYNSNIVKNRILESTEKYTDDYGRTRTNVVIMLPMKDGKLYKIVTGEPTVYQGLPFYKTQNIFNAYVHSPIFASSDHMRENLCLFSNNPRTTTNIQMLQIAADMLADYISSNPNTENIHYLAIIKFNGLTECEEVQKKLNDIQTGFHEKIKTAPIAPIITKTGRKYKRINEIKTLQLDVVKSLRKNKILENIVWKILSEKYPDFIPEASVLCDFSDIHKEMGISNQIGWSEIRDLSNVSDLNSDEIRTVWDGCPNKSECFPSSFKFPNILGERINGKDALRFGDEMVPFIRCFADAFPSLAKRILDDKFCDINMFHELCISTLHDQLLNECTLFDDKKEIEKIQKNVVCAWVALCLSYIKVSTGEKSILKKLAIRYPYGKEVQPHELFSETDIKKMIQAVTRYALFDFARTENEKNEDWLLSLLDAINAQNYLKGLISEYPIIKTQSGTWALAGSLYHNKSIHPDVIDIYNNWFGVNILNVLTDSTFEKFIDKSRTKSTCDLAEEIEKIIDFKDLSGIVNDDGMFSRIDVIGRHITDESSDKGIWHKSFPKIAKKYGELCAIMLSRKCQNINLLFDAIKWVEANEREAEENERRRNQGKIVEKAISDLLRQQGFVLRKTEHGCDYLIMNNDKDEYHIEVKSRWGIEKDAQMTIWQFIESARNCNNYALIYVDMEGVDYVQNDRIKVLTQIGEYANDFILNDAGPLRLEDSKVTVPFTAIQQNGIGIDSFIDILRTNGFN